MGTLYLNPFRVSKSCLNSMTVAGRCPVACGASVNRKVSGRTPASPRRASYGETPPGWNTLCLRMSKFIDSRSSHSRSVCRVVLAINPRRGCWLHPSGQASVVCSAELLAASRVAMNKASDICDPWNRCITCGFRYRHTICLRKQAAISAG